MCRGPRVLESTLPIPIRRKHSPPWCGARPAWSPVRGSPGCGRPDANHLHAPGRAIDREVAHTVGDRVVAGDEAAALSRTMSQLYQELAFCLTQFVFRH